MKLCPSQPGKLAAPLLKAWVSTPHTPLDSVCRQIGVAGLQQALVDAAGLLNTPQLVEQATANPRYRWERNKGVPRKIGSKLWLYDCINCDKCVPVCPNDANFVYETAAGDIPYDNFELTPEGARRAAGGVLKSIKAHQLANYADACNDCGNCDVFCPEDGGPYSKSRGSSAASKPTGSTPGRNGFYIEFDAGRKTLYGTVAGQAYTLTLDPAADRAWFDDGTSRSG